MEYNQFNPEINLNNYSPKQINLSITLEHLYKLHEEYSWKEIADMYNKSERTIYRWVDQTIKPKQKEGRKFKFGEEIEDLILNYVERNNTSTQRAMADYVFQHLGISISQQTVSRILKRKGITYKNLTYHYEQMPTMEEIKKFVDMVRGLPSEQLLALDECGFHLNEDPRRGYSLIGKRAIAKRPSSKGEHYTLLLCVRNINGKGVVHYKLIKGGAKLESFYDFLEGIDLSDSEKYYLLLDNARIHWAPKKRKKLGLPTIEKQLNDKNTELIYFPPYTPQLNSTELCFNFLRREIEKNRPRNFEQLKLFIDKAIEKLNEKDLSEYFRHCWDYFKFENTDISCE